MLAATAYCTERGRESERFRDAPGFAFAQPPYSGLSSQISFILRGHAAALSNTGPPNLSIGCSQFRRANGPSNIARGF